MEKLIYFEANPGNPGVIMFVMDYQRKKWFRREKIAYTLNISFSNRYQSYSEDDFEAIEARIKQDYPNAQVWKTDVDSFIDAHRNNRFWVVCTWLNNVGRIGYYSDNDRHYKAEYTEDMSDVRMILSESSANEILRNIQRSTRDRVWVQDVYLNLINELLTPVLMITCTSRKSEETKFFARAEGNRLRLVNTSEAAKKFPYEEAIQMFEYLRTHNKNFLYAVLPGFKDNVSCRNLEAYMKANKVTRMIALDMKLKHLSRK